ncbi:MAG: hypothetical protein RL215_2959 [Planctomycetota bacterium]
MGVGVRVRETGDGRAVRFFSKAWADEVEVWGSPAIAAAIRHSPFAICSVAVFSVDSIVFYVP